MENVDYTYKVSDILSRDYHERLSRDEKVDGCILSPESNQTADKYSEPKVRTKTESR